VRTPLLTAYDRWYEGRKLLGTMTNFLRELCQEAYSAQPGIKPDTDTDVKAALMDSLARDIRRRVNILFAFVRCVGRCVSM
jgi:predicted membrane chloride channel (bestrophin family)